MINLTSADIPKTAELTLSPASQLFSIGMPVRLYECDTSGSNAKLVNTMTWNSTTTFDVNPSSKNYCLSDSMTVYSDGSSLLSTPTSVSENGLDESPVDYDEENSEDTSYEFSWDDTEDTNEVQQTEEKSKLPIVWILLAVAVVLALISGATLLLIHNKNNKVVEFDAMEDDDIFDADSSEDDFDFDESDDE